MLNYTNRRRKPILIAVFAIYIMIVLKLTVFRKNVYYPERQLNLTLFLDLIRTFNKMGPVVFLRLFLGNIGWFVPFGFLLPLCTSKGNMRKTVLLGIAFSLTIEIAQFVLNKGVAELDDVILNTLGTAAGYYLYRIIATKRFHRSQ